MKQNAKQTKKKRGGQPGNQNARTHGHYSRLISPREAEVLKAVAGLDQHGQSVILNYLLTADDSRLLESYSFRSARKKAQRMPDILDEVIDSLA